MTVEIKNLSGDILLTIGMGSLRGANLQAANLRRANLRGANLQAANLRGANLGAANLQAANLWGANLGGADLRRANLQAANLRGANLGGADLWGANLQGANLQAANLGGADLRRANLQAANLRGANLGGADLQGANLQGANLQGANLQGADLRGARNADLVIAQTRILPDTGEVIGWKKAQQDAIVQLRIPADAKRSHAMGRKCRAEKAEVLAIFGSDGSPTESAVSIWDDRFTYMVGATVEPTDPFDEDMWDECSSGIHFYITRIEAENHV